MERENERIVISQSLLFYSKFRMRAPHDLDAILPEDTCKCFDFPAQLLISPIMTAADPEVDRLRMQLYDPLHRMKASISSGSFP